MAVSRKYVAGVPFCILRKSETQKMFKYYLMVITATLLYSFQFIFSKSYQRRKGSSFFYSMIFSAISCLATIPFLFVLNKGKVEFTWFSFAIALLYAIDVIICSVFGAKILSKANLSVYSLFLMLGGMILPFLYGLTIGENFTALKAVSIVSVAVAMIFSLKKDEEKNLDGFTIFCFIVIFVTNGMTGVLTYMHQRSTRAIVSAGGFLILYNLCRFILSAAILFGIFVYGKNKNREVLLIRGADDTGKEISAKSEWMIAVAASVGYAVMNGTAVLFTTITAKYIDAGIQSTIITGGVMLLSTLSGLIFGEKPTKNTFFAVFFAVLGTVLIML